MLLGRTGVSTLLPSSRRQRCQTDFVFFFFLFLIAVVVMMPAAASHQLAGRRQGRSGHGAPPLAVHQSLCRRWATQPGSCSRSPYTHTHICLRSPPHPLYFFHVGRAQCCVAPAFGPVCSAAAHAAPPRSLLAGAWGVGGLSVPLLTMPRLPLPRYVPHAFSLCPFNLKACRWDRPQFSRLAPPQHLHTPLYNESPAKHMYDDYCRAI